MDLHDALEPERPQKPEIAFIRMTRPVQPWGDQRKVDGRNEGCVAVAVALALRLWGEQGIWDGHRLSSRCLLLWTRNEG